MFCINTNLIIEGFARRCCTHCVGVSNSQLRRAALVVISTVTKVRRGTLSLPSLPFLYFTLIHVTELATQPYLYTFHLVKYLLM